MSVGRDGLERLRRRRLPALGLGRSPVGGLPSRGVTPLPRVAVGAVVVADGALLLIQRGAGVAVGSWSLPGGHVEAGETMAAATLRELAEETGLTGAVDRLCGIVERAGPGRHYVIIDFWVALDDRQDRSDAVAGDDADAVAWVDAGRLAALEHAGALVEGLYSFLDDHGVLARLT